MTRYPRAAERLSQQQFLRVVRLAVELDADAVRCAEAEAYYAACLIAACALEAALLANVLAFEPDMEAAGTWPPSREPPERWGLAALVRFHLEQGWIEPPAAPLDLAEGVEVTNWIRNVVAHPGRLIREASEFEIDEKAAQAVYITLQSLFEEMNKLYERESRS